MADLPCIHQLFERQAARTPHARALAHGERTLTYAQLDALANRVANHLRGLGTAVEEPVGIWAERSPEMVVAVLGILKAGAAFVPLERSHPLPRLAAMMAGAGVRRVLTAGDARPLLRLDEPPELVALDAPGALGDAGDDDPRVPLVADNLAYVMHTSGSTGVPKGVLVPHAGLVNYLRWCCEAYGARAGQGSAVQSPISTSMIFPSLFAPLCVGGAVTLLPETAGVESLAALLSGPRSEPFSFLKVTPSQLRLLAPRLEGVDLAGRVRTLVIGAEPLDEHTVAPWRRAAPDTRLVNEYGPTETIVGRTVHVLPPEPAGEGALPIGRPIAGTRIHLVDEQLGAVGDGETGEICIAGVGIARGYAGQAARTAEVFVPDPFAGEPGARMYRTGDLGRVLPGGDLACLGRGDDQVKIRGFRVEPGDVASALRAHPGVADAFVTARPRPGGDHALVAYVVPARAAPAGGPPLPVELRAHVRARLPEHMVPAAVVTVDAIPTTAVGKVDRRALPDPPAARPELDRPYVAPAGDDERAVAALWAQLLGLDEVGVDDDFLALGGDSLLAGRVAQRTGERLDVEVTMADVIEARSVRALLERVERRRREGAAPRRLPPLRSYRGRPQAGAGVEGRP